MKEIPMQLRHTTWIETDSSLFLCPLAGMLLATFCVRDKRDHTCGVSVGFEQRKDPRSLTWVGSETLPIKFLR